MGMVVMAVGVVGLKLVVYRLSIGVNIMCPGEVVVGVDAHVVGIIVDEGNGGGGRGHGGRRGEEVGGGCGRVVLTRTWAPSIANGQISHGQQRRYSHRDGQRRKGLRHRRS